MQTWDIRYTRSAYPPGLGLVGHQHRDGTGVAGALAVARHGDAQAIVGEGGGGDLADLVAVAGQREGTSEEALQLALEAIAVPAWRGQSGGGEQALSWPSRRIRHPDPRHLLTVRPGVETGF